MTGDALTSREARVSTPSVRKEFSLRVQVRRIVRLANCSLVRLLIRLKRFLFLRSPVQGSFRSFSMPFHERDTVLGYLEEVEEKKASRSFITELI